MSNPNLNRPLYTLCQYSGGIRTDHTSTSNPIYSTAGTLYELYSDSTARVQAMRQRLMTNTSSRFVPEFKLKPQAQTQLPCYATSPQIFCNCSARMAAFADLQQRVALRDLVARERRLRPRRSAGFYPTF